MVLFRSCWRQWVVPWAIVRFSRLRLVACTSVLPGYPCFIHTLPELVVVILKFSGCQQPPPVKHFRRYSLLTSYHKALSTTVPGLLGFVSFEVCRLARELGPEAPSLHGSYTSLCLSSVGGFRRRFPDIC